MKISYKIVNVLSLCLLVSGCTSKEQTRDEFVQGLVEKMTLDEKVGQMTQVDKRMLDSESDIAKYFLGSLLSGGGSVPADNTPGGWVDMINSYQKQALSTRLKIPLIYGIDAVHGHNNVVGATVFPHNIGLGCSNNPDIVYKVNQATAVEVAATGLHWTFSPCITVPKDDRWGRQYEGFSESTEIVTRLTHAAITGYEDALDVFGGKKIAACAKHFIGDGGTTWETGSLQEGMHTYKIDRGNTKLTEEELRKIHLPPYLEAIKAGVKTIMISYNSWNGVKCHGSKFLINDLLKEELNFEGLVVTDWAGIDEIPGDYKSDIITSINAGIDLVMVPGALYGNSHYKTFIELLKESVEEGSIPLSRIDDAITRILRVKYDIGLFDDPYGKVDHASQVGSEKNRQVARNAVKMSMVLLKNELNVLPLKKNQKVTIVGSGANNLGMQNGGWTVEWQGRSTPDFKILDNNNDEKLDLSEVTSYFKSAYDAKYDAGSANGFFKNMDKDSDGDISMDEFKKSKLESPYQPSGTSILNAIEGAIDSEGLITYDPRAEDLSKGGVILAVVGENPYTEGVGDNPTIGLSSFDTAILERCYESGNKLVVVVLSGRPLIIEDHVSNWDGLIAAWLPGMAGEGVSDVLYGDYSPTGKLSYSWPKNTDQLPLNEGDAEYDPLFPFGYGLSY
ncbi:MAG: beta-glucosidase [Candidatus Marinimicrobia bacterium]|nr:beta-glucosidase [Candidatus Neomarinimicrobiota bacterium]